MNFNMEEQLKVEGLLFMDKNAFKSQLLVKYFVIKHEI